MFEELSLKAVGFSCGLNAFFLRLNKEELINRFLAGKFLLIFVMQDLVRIRMGS
jgi:hypothetical protein